MEVDKSESSAENEPKQTVENLDSLEGPETIYNRQTGFNT